PDLRLRVVNVVDLMRMQPDTQHPHGLSDKEFDSLFTVDRPVVFAYHGYPWLIHRLTYRRTNHGNLHVRGYKEEGTTTTPFDMVMLNDLDRFHLVIDVIDRLPHLAGTADHLRQDMSDSRLAARRALPDIPHVAVFDTAFHATIPDVAATYALPAEWRRDIRRYGFHGLSVQWASERLGVKRLVVCHLGGGCSVTAVRDGRSIDTTMGFTPLEGVPMATRPGSVDPGAFLYLLKHHLTLDALDRLLEHDSGLAGLSGLSGDLRELESSNAPAARFALAVFTYRVATAVGAMTTALGGLEALVFTAGIG